MFRKPTYEELEHRIKDLEEKLEKQGLKGELSQKGTENTEFSSPKEINVSDIMVKWDVEKGECTFETLPVAMMWVDTTLAGLMSGVQSMVGKERFALALQAEGRNSVEADWQVISQFPNFEDGFKAIANIAAIAGWGAWRLVAFDEKQRECKFHIHNSWEGLYQKSMGVCWGSGMLAGKMAGYCSKLFSTNCWAEQTKFIAEGDEYDEFVIKPSDRSIEKEIEDLLASDEATRADMAVALQKLKKEINERTRAEKELKESEERFRLLSKASFEGIGIVEKGVIIEANKQMSEMFGYGHHELIGMEVMNLVAPESRDLVIQNIKSGYQEPYEHLAVKKDGSIVHVEVRASTIPYKGRMVRATAINDMTERKKAEEALRESEEKYRILYENANDAICVAQDEMVKFPNPRTEDITGYSKEELVKMPFTNLIHPEDRAMVLERHKKRLAGEKPPPTYSFRITNKEGEERWVQLNTVLIDWEGRPASLNFLRDMTQQRKLEAQLIQAQRMESIGTLAGGIAHDFNNLLSPIMVYSEMGMMELPSDSPIQQNLTNIYKSGERARDLVKQILTFARKGETEKAPIKISSIVKERIKLLRSTIPSTIEINYDLKAKQDIVLGDRTQMDQIVMNLCTNAVHAMPERGMLEIRTSIEFIGPDELELYTDLNPGQYLRLSVSDTGSGISPDVMDNIFEPYFTTKDPDKGTGMGLAVVHGIVKGYSGDITVESEVGKGTTVHVLLPLIESEVSITEEVKTQVPTGSEHILLVDDEKIIIEVIQGMLERLGYEVTARTSSIEALEAFRHKTAVFDLVITDMTMPNMTGKELARELMCIRPDIPIILCTGFSEQIDEGRAKEIGISAFVMKPIVIHDIANKIRDVLDKKVM